MKHLLLVLIPLLFCLRLAAQDLSHSRYEDSLLVQRYDSLAMSAFEAHEFAEAIGFADQAETMAEELWGSSSFTYIELLSLKANLYAFSGDYDTAFPLYQRAYELILEHLGEDHELVGDVTGGLGAVYNSRGQYDKALYYFEISLENTGIHYGKESAEYGVSLNNLGVLNKWVGNYRAALEQTQEALRITGLTLGEEHSKYGIRLNSVAQVYESLERHDKSIPLTHQALEISSKNKDPYYGTYLNNLAMMYVDIGLTNEALTYAIESKEHTVATFGKDHPDYIQRLQTLGVLYDDLGKSDTAIAFLRQAVSLSEKKLGKNHPFSVIRLNNLGEAYASSGQYDSALQCFDSARVAMENGFGKLHYAYVGICKQLAWIYGVMEDYDQAKIFVKEGITIQKSLMEGQKGGLGFMYALAANIYWQTNDIDSAYHFLNKSNEVFSMDIQYNFALLSEEAQEQYTEKLNPFFYLQYSIGWKHHREIPDLPIMAYDNALRFKNLRLSSAQKMRESLETSSSDQLRKDYLDWERNKQLLGKQFSLPESQRFISIDSLTEYIEALEAHLALNSREFREVNEIANWKDIQLHLDENEAAIEYVHFHPMPDTGSYPRTFYAALVLTAQSDVPHFIPLFEESEQHEIFHPEANNAKKRVQEMYQSDLYALIWQPIDSLMTGVERIYYSPSGILNRISFSAIPDQDGQYLSDRYQLIYKSSTQKLIHSKGTQEKSDLEQIMIFSDIDFNNFDEELSFAASGYDKAVESTFSYQKLESNQRSISRGRYWYDLPKTKEESQKIEKLFGQHNVSIDVLSKKMATEESFKELGGKNKSPDIIHLATHGFFFKDPSQMDVEKSSKQLGGQGNFRFAENPLFRSGIVLAGANQAWKEKSFEEGREDGILSAYEISNMRLKGTDLVVLSACQTGLGEDSSTEGVYGLHRAFKMAGVDYLLLTLWSIADSDETVEFMERFYELILSGTSIPDAFSQTQKDMRAKYPDPYYWAGFILVD